MLSVKRIMVAGLCLAAMGVVSAADAGAGRMVTAFAKGCAKPQISPDGHYTARLSVGEAEAGVLVIHRVGRLGRPVGSPVLRAVSDVDGAVWLPCHPHTLAFGATGLYGRAFLGVWDGHRLHSLRRVTDPDSEMYRMLGASTDGKTLYYRQGRDSAGGLVWHEHHLRLPQGLT